MKKEVWKELRGLGYKRRFLIKSILVYRTRLFFCYILHLWYKLTKFEHKHRWNDSWFCLVCKKSKRDIDIEMLDKLNRL